MKFSPIGVPTHTWRNHLCGKTFFRLLTNEEKAHFVAVYNAYAETWNSHENDRNKPLLGSHFNGLGFQMFNYRDQLTLDLEWCEVSVIANTPDWDTWQSGFYNFGRNKLREEDVTDLAAYVDREINRKFINLRNEFDEAIRRCTSPIGKK